MAKIAFNPAIEGIRGAMSKSGMIARQKIYRDARGRITGYGRQEAYFIANPRDFKRHPMRGKELAYHDLWREVCLQAKNELADAEKRAVWQVRFEAQSWSVKGSRPDSMAPVDKSTGAQKRYSQLPAFVRAMIYQEKKASMSA